MILSPRETFTTSPNKEPMQKIGQNLAFLAACDYSVLILIEELNNPIDPTGLAQIIGARRVLEILKTIAEPTKEKEPPKTPSLNYKLK